MSVAKDLEKNVLALEFLGRSLPVGGSRSALEIVTESLGNLLPRARKMERRQEALIFTAEQHKREEFFKDEEACWAKLSES